MPVPVGLVTAGAPVVHFFFAFKVVVSLACGHCQTGRSFGTEIFFFSIL